MTRVFLRVETPLGPRTIISQDLPSVEAWNVQGALEGVGLTAHITEDATPVDMQTLIKRRRKALKVETEKPSAIVTNFPARKPMTTYRKG